VSAQEIFIGGKNQVIIMCLRCGREKTVESSKIMGVSKPVRVKCTCGHAFDVVFEKRSFYRKPTHLPGYYAKVGEMGNLDEMIVVNLSKGGVGLEIVGSKDIREGDVLRVDFKLDNEPRTPIKTDIVVRAVKGQYVGGQFTRLDEHSKTKLGFYLMP